MWWHNPFGWFFGSIIGIIVFIISLVLFLLPTIIAVARHHRNRLAIFLINLLLGWTGVGWLVALVWALIG
jgi:hypothetical protein